MLKKGKETENLYNIIEGDTIIYVFYEESFKTLQKYAVLYLTKDIQMVILTIFVVPVLNYNSSIYTARFRNPYKFSSRATILRNIFVVYLGLQPEYTEI